ncbi:MAG: LytTR family transcriptional regulator DNA-binding domain-containing protein [Bacteroidetes bacterium]|nr:LytTR family transcriptional regulator DNA-binding domain-containing protein [Bacteroidota bacterium]
MNLKLNILIVEDEPIIADHIEQYVLDAGFNSVGITDSYTDAKRLIDDKHPDLMLLDINLGDGPDGVDLAHYINQTHKKPFIFITSNTDNKTLERVKLTNPSGFIIKPFKAKDIETQINLAWHSYSTQKENQQINFSDSFLVNDHFFIKDKHSLIKVNYADVLYAEACDNYSIIYTRQTKYVLSYPLKVVEEKLSPFHFFRTHRSFLVNLHHIEKVNPKEVIVNGKEIPVSENSRAELIQKLNLF